MEVSVKKRVTLGEILQKECGVPARYIEIGLIQQKSEKEQGRNPRLGNILLSMNIVSPEVLARALARQANLPYIPCVTLDFLQLPDIDPRVAETHRFFPVEIGSDYVKVAFEDPYSYEAENAARRQFVGKRIVKCVASKLSVNRYVQTRQKVTADDVFDALRGKNYGVALKLLLRKAIVEECSDMHIEPSFSGVKVKYRKDGVLHLFMIVPPEHSNNLRQVALKEAGIDFTKNRQPQDGRIHGEFVDAHFKKVDMRVSYLPTFLQDNYSIVIRFLNQGASALPLSELGLSSEVQLFLRKAVNKSCGLVLLCGPTGSGKSTTIYSTLSLVDAIERKVITVEDPVEYRSYLWDQTQVNPANNYTFATAMKTLLRHDPDIILVGEIRDRETAKMAVEAANTGHLVFSTLHTNSAITAVTRLLTLGVCPEFLEGCLLGVVAQRLVRHLCPKCKVPSGKLGFLPSGCQSCGKTGYQGRIAISEVIPFAAILGDGDKDLKLTQQDAAQIYDLLVKGNIFQALEKIKQSGLKTMKDDAIEKVKKGITSILEVERVL